MSSTSKKVKLTELAELFAAEPVDVVYLFGSQARGDTGPLSDVDVALLLRPGVSRKAAFDLRLRMMAALGRLFDTDEIDVVVLNDAPLLLQHRVLRDGKVLFCRHELRRVRYEARAISKYLDFQHLENIYNRALLARLARGGLGERARLGRHHSAAAEVG
ncbi:MAG: nucleotidyltransferase domain-containing protein [Chloroflexi bacterium]|nr:nucleotidyltransferase domain-containing protein [Chloroflexota bacterium]